MVDVKPAAEESKPRRSRNRQFRLWEKKRGSRQTGSSWWGAAGETIFFCVLFFVGVVALTELVSLRVIGRTDSFLTSNWGLLLSILMMSSLIIAGAVGAIYSVVLTGTSAERRAALAKQATDSEFITDVQHSAHDYPNVPDDSNWKNSPGIRLTYRLPSACSASWRLGIVASFCLLWNGAVAVFAVLALNRDDGALGGSILQTMNPPLFYTIISIYALIGLWSVYWLVRMLLAAAAIGPTSVEVSSLPLRPGQQCAIYLAQSGHLRVRWLELKLVCDEEVSFSDGTDTRGEITRVHDQTVFREEDFEISPSHPFEHECPLEVPEDAMHSFMAANNAVTWKLIVAAAANKWPRFERVFPLVLYPPYETSSKHDSHRSLA